MNVHANDEAGFLAACANGHVEVVRELLALTGDRAVDLHSMHGRRGAGVMSFRAACTNGHVEVVRWLVREGGADPNQGDEQGRTAVLVAAEGGHREVAKWLVCEGGADPA